MALTLAIHNDAVSLGNGEQQSFSQRWKELAAANNIAVVEVEHDMPDFMATVRACDGFMWRFGFTPEEINIAGRIIPAIEQGMGIPVFPNWRTMWHFEDKIAQSYLLEAGGIPSAETKTIWQRKAALEYCQQANYPLVFKLSNGIQSENVRLVQNFAQASETIDQLFTTGAYSFATPSSRLHKLLGKHLIGLRTLLGRRYVPGLQGGYLYVQEFLPDNRFDTRVAITGDRAFAFRRFNRDNDFRASGSGKIDWNPEAIDPNALRLAFRVADQLNTQSVAIDVLHRDGEPIVAEISYTYAAWAVRDCPGHWCRDRASAALNWQQGKMRPEDAHFEQFIAELKRHREPTAPQS